MAIIDVSGKWKYVEIVVIMILPTQQVFAYMQESMIMSMPTLIKHNLGGSADP